MLNVQGFVEKQIHLIQFSTEYVHKYFHYKEMALAIINQL